MVAGPCEPFYREYAKQQKTVNSTGLHFYALAYEDYCILMVYELSSADTAEQPRLTWHKSDGSCLN